MNNLITQYIGYENINFIGSYIDAIRDFEKEADIVFFTDSFLVQKKINSDFEKYRCILSYSNLSDIKDLIQKAVSFSSSINFDSYKNILIASHIVIPFEKFPTINKNEIIFDDKFLYGNYFAVNIFLKRMDDAIDINDNSKNTLNLKVKKDDRGFLFVC